MTKLIRVTMPDGSRWDVPADIVARNRATYYARKESGQEPDTAEYTKVFKHEFDYAYNKDMSELYEWAESSMDWEGVAEHARCVNYPGPVDYQEGWINGDKEIIVVE